MNDLDALFVGREPQVRATFDRSVTALAALGPLAVQAKKPSIHLARRSAFAGVQPRKGSILLNIRTAAPLDSARVRKVEHVSANRFHNEMLLEGPGEVDAELLDWLGEAYALSA